MLRALRTAALGMTAQQQYVDNTANNLSNVNTTGFKRSTVVFQDLMYQTVRAAGQGGGEGAAAAELQMGHGAAAVATKRNFVQGSFSETGNPMDIAINGDGFFQVQRPDGSIGFTRDGQFALSAEGEIVTQTGLPLEPGIQVPTEASGVMISEDGIVSALIQGEPAPIELGQIELARFTNPAGLRAVGGNLYEPTDASGEATIGTAGTDGLGVMRQGYTETSNVDVVQEMVNLIQAQRAYEINSKMVTTSEEMLTMANQMKR